MLTKNLAVRVRQQAIDQMRAKLLRTKPVWFDAVTRIPPGPTIVRDPSLFSTNVRLPFERAADKAAAKGEAAPPAPQQAKPALYVAPKWRAKAERTTATKSAGRTTTEAGEKTSEFATAAETAAATSITLVPSNPVVGTPWSTPRTASHHKLRTRPPKPPQIVFPEDQLRRRFYQDHPHELLRPRSVQETTNGVNRTDWSQLHDPIHYPGPVTGEHVIQHQLYLMRTHRLTEQAAYARAVGQFYRIRAREDLERKVAEEQAYHFGAKPLVSDAEINLRLEAKQLIKSDKVLEEKEAIRRMQSASAEKNFKNTEAGGVFS
ncbi:mitochondrial ribosomal small subunit component [Tieghemiomyces parasiticus]|uniref:Small ribosomal subunit protein mS23 n=1 Tax=Tieghemiomyces parasiticus TaxID=78921 RepID=A0A9W7ZXP1_9FUNG|nr:mitochondrial ribosomal small subunit component [Tieghemiomyces parasiticus]